MRPEQSRIKASVSGSGMWLLGFVFVLFFSFFASPGLSATLARQPTGLPNPQTSPERARQEARDILSRPEYQPPPKTWIDSVMEWLSERFRDMFANIGGGPGGPVMWVVLALLVGGLVFFLYKIRGSLGLRKKADDDPLFTTELEASRSPVEWLTEAERLESNGEWKGALRCRYRALIGHLIAKGIVRDIPGRTSGEFRIETRRRAPDMAKAFASASELFDEVWYGDRKTGREDNARFRALAAEVADLSSAKPEQDGGPAGDEPLRISVGSK